LWSISVDNSRMMPRMKPYWGALFFLVACGGGGGTNMDTMGDDTPIDAAPDAFVPPEGFTKLISGKWSLAAGQHDTYHCTRLTIANDTYITNIMAVAPVGSHHTVLSISSSRTQGPDGEYACDVSELGMQMLYASGVGTAPLDFPSGVGIKIAAGTQIHLNLHLFNASDNPISGESAILVKASSTAPAMLAEMVFAGKFLFSIPSNNQDYNVTGGCTSNRNFNLFAVWPHMHQIANHQKFEITHNGTTTVIHDGPFAFGEQNYYLQSPIFQVSSGDMIKTTCTFKNNSGGAITFGDSSNKEMCFTGMYRYPAAGAGLFECTDNPGF
jgi:hypothetical protein